MMRCRTNSTKNNPKYTCLIRISSRRNGSMDVVGNKTSWWRLLPRHFSEIKAIWLAF